MSQNKVDILERALKREKAARKSAEKILEDKSRKLYLLSEELKDTNSKLEDLLDEKSSTLKGIFENINDAYLVMDLHGNVLKMNEVAINLFGYNIENEKFNVTDIIYKDDLEYAYNSFSQLNEQGFFNGYTARIITKNKQVKWLQINGTLIYDKNKKPIAAQGIVRDITKDKEAGDLLMESKNRLSALVLNLNSGVILEDENRKIVLSNTKFCELLNIDAQPNDLIGMDCKLASEQNKVQFKEPLSFVKRINEIDAAKVAVFGDQLEMLDGKVLERNYMPIIVGGKLNGYLWTFRDISLEKKYNLSLEAQKEKYSSIIANMNLGLVEVNKEKEILMVNQSFIEMSGYSEKELLGKIEGDFFSLENAVKVSENEHFRRLKDVSSSYELKIKNKKGKIRHWLVSGAPNYDLFGKVIGSIGIHLDITELKKLQLQKENILKELENRNNELSEYAHIVSHDLKSPLRSIDALVSWVKADNEGKIDEATLQNLGLIETTLETMEKLISNVLEYSSAGTNKHEAIDVDLNDTLSNLKKVLFIPKNISVNVLKSLPIIKGDQTKFQQLFQNFISNAIKFCDKEVGVVDIDYIDNKTFYQFSIKDNGIGIEKKYHDKIFKIFHALDKRDDSTGIGLAIVKKIITLYGGDIWLESEPNKGTTFYFTIKKIK
ncbi:PAS domain-containing sensor histidine kinase [Polaribacter sp. SA4-10]|uniref:PAS domain-containing sensor histidine kinase n=1 Tax=Polaribacter sp. SA4-10 TaxID=754397 RepID=UPI000B3C9087|nr:PAS domain S-box protein [Polaribacter sp. SA4-10]ARV05455.1 PAS domain-containing sensor histidine kinase [Polaribacter sp. SA4-10]